MLVCFLYYHPGKLPAGTLATATATALIYIYPCIHLNIPISEPTDMHALPSLHNIYPGSHLNYVPNCYLAFIIIYTPHSISVVSFQGIELIISLIASFPRSAPRLRC